jgi:hypothetical protein
MTATGEFVNEVRDDANAAALRLLAADEGASRALVQALERHLSSEPLSRLERVWDLSGAQAASVFGVSRQAYAKWHVTGVPADRQADVAELSSATSTLLAYVKVDRIPAVVRRPAAILDGESLLAVATRAPRAARVAADQMFDLRRVQG